MKYQSNFSSLLLKWFKKNKRILPWRIDGNWYKTWVSEVMLQQTQVKQVVPFFEKFMAKFPDPDSLACADIDSVLEIWQGLGYYARAHNLLKSARKLKLEHNSNLPSELNDIKKLPGFGPYISAAVLSIAFNKPFAVVDGNVKRVISRLFAIEADIKLPATIKKIERIAARLLHKKYPGQFNEAMMELGAIICLPANPKCSDCPLQKFCRSYKQKTVNKIPFKNPKKKKPTRYFIVNIISNKGNYRLCRNKNTGFLSGLWEFPTGQIPENKIPSLYRDPKSLTKEKAVYHSYTHFNAWYIIEFNSDSMKVEEAGNYQECSWFSPDDISKLAKHRVTDKIIELIKNHNLKTGK